MLLKNKFLFLCLILFLLESIPVQAQKAFEPFLENVANSIIRESDITISPETGEPVFQSSVPETETEFEPTYHQINSFPIRETEEQIPVHSYCVDSDGNLLIGMGGDHTTYEMKDGVRVSNSHSFPGEIRIFTPGGELLTTLSPGIVPHALAVAPDGSIYAAGNEQAVRLSPEGKVELTRTLEIIPNREKLLAECQKKAKAILEKQSTQYSELIKTASSLVEALSSNAKEERSKFQQKHLDQARKQLEFYKEQEKISTVSNPEAKENMEEMTMYFFNRKTEIMDITLSETDLFLSTVSQTGNGLSIWRLNHQLAEPVEIISNLTLNCGPLYLQSQGSDFWVFQNSRDCVARFNRTGERTDPPVPGLSSKDKEQAGCRYEEFIQVSGQGNLLVLNFFNGRIMEFKPRGKATGFLGKADHSEKCLHSQFRLTRDGKQIYHINLVNNLVSVLEKTSGDQ